MATFNRVALAYVDGDLEAFNAVGGRLLLRQPAARVAG